MSDMTEGFDPNPPTPALHGYPPLSCATVLGAGAWGTALASALQRGGVPTWLWARRLDVAEAIHGRNHHPQCLPGIALPSGLGAAPDLAHALHGAQLVILAVPSAATRDIARQAAPLITPGTLVLTASKGIEQGSGALMTQVLDEELGRAVLTGSIGGPSFADEVDELAEGAVSALSAEILERKYGLRLNVAAAVRDVLQQRAAPEHALHRLLHESAPGMTPPVARTPRPAAVRPRIGRDSDSRPAVQPWGLGYA